MITVMGMVIIHAIAIFLTVFIRRFFFFLATIVPAIPDVRTWVVLTGNPIKVESPMVLAATISADAP